ncbi:hypothetical protein DFJ77DRAFT_359784 [Powellomyces hirtus]|nr:hypothetical protein DFJ77DRAFT_359784 [Powellomyces hirtus]
MATAEPQPPPYTSSPPTYQAIFPSYVVQQYDPQAPILLREPWTGRSVSYVGAQLNTDELRTIFNHLAQNTTVQNLYLGGNNGCLTDFVGPYLVRALRANHTLVSLRLDRCSLGPATGGFMGIVLRHNNTLQSLNLRDNALGEDGMTNMAKALEAMAVSARTNTALKELDISINLIGDAGCIALATCLSAGHLPGLQTLHLNFNGLTNLAASALAKVIRVHPALERLYLAENFIERKGALQLGAAASASPRFALVSLLLNGRIRRMHWFARPNKKLILS